MADVINDEVPSDPAATKVCKKCGRRFPTGEFVSARGTPTLLCRICRKSSNDSHRRKRQGVAAQGPVNPQPQPLPQQQQQQQQQTQQQTQQAMTAQPSAVHQQQHLQLEQHDYFEEFQDEGFEEFLQYPPVPIDGLLPLATSNNDDDHSSAAPTGGNVEHTNTSAQFEQAYTDHMNNLFVANNSEAHAEYPAIVPRIITDLQAVFESDAADVTSAMPFSEHSNGATIETRRTGQLEQYRVRVDSQAFLERIE